MSWQAMGGVQLHSQFAGDEPGNFAPFRIMLALAWFADPAGVIGVAGNHRRCPGQQAIADRARVHRNTIGNWLPALLESGELEIITSGGGGRGAWTQYRITLPMDSSPGDVQIPAELAQGAADLRVLIREEFAQLRAELAQGIAQQIAELAQRISTISTTLPEVAHPDPYDPIDPVLDPGEGDPPPPPEPPPPEPPPPEPPTAAGTPTNQDDAYADEMWQLAQGVVGDWLRLVGHYRKLSPQNAAHSADYYAPAVRLVHEFGGDRAAAWTALESAYAGMLHAGMTPRRLAPVVEQVVGNLNRQRSPVPAAAARPQPSANGSGGQQPRAVAALEEFKRRLAQQESDA